jgi:dolichol-phosphate mannosyltransferase
LPCYNEVENISLLIPEIFQVLPEASIVVIDDNSPDGTGDAVRALKDKRVKLISREKKEGYGTAMIAGYDYALQNDFTHILQMDVDFSHPPEVLRSLLEKSKEADFVVGCRYMKGGGTKGWGAFRKILSAGGNLFARTILNLPYKDMTGGLRLYRRSVLEELSPEMKTMDSKGYIFLVDMFFRIHQHKFKVGEVPYVFQDRVRGKSKMNARIILEAMFQVISLRRRK